MPEPTSPNAPESADALFDAVYARLKAMAARQLGARERGTLDTTALVHEVYLDICKLENPAAVQDYFGYAARAMRNLLIDHARRYLRPKHGGDLQRTVLDSQAMDGVRIDAGQAIELDSALNRLAELDPRAARIVELHFFAGLGLERIAVMAALNLSYELMQAQHNAGSSAAASKASVTMTLFIFGPLLGNLQQTHHVTTAHPWLPPCVPVKLQITPPLRRPAIQRDVRARDVVVQFVVHQRGHTLVEVDGP